jgi:hypothetical protein
VREPGWGIKLQRPAKNKLGRPENRRPCSSQKDTVLPEVSASLKVLPRNSRWPSEAAETAWPAAGTTLSDAVTHPLPHVLHLLPLLRGQNIADLLASLLPQLRRLFPLLLWRQRGIVPQSFQLLPLRLQNGLNLLLLLLAQIQRPRHAVQTSLARLRAHAFQLLLLLGRENALELVSALLEQLAGALSLLFGRERTIVTQRLKLLPGGFPHRLELCLLLLGQIELSSYSLPAPAGEAEAFVAFSRCLGKADPGGYNQGSN